MHNQLSSVICTDLNIFKLQQIGKYEFEVQNSLIKKAGFLFAPLYLIRAFKQVRRGRSMQALNEHTMSLLRTCWMSIISICKSGKWTVDLFIFSLPEAGVSLGKRSLFTQSSLFVTC